jgi:formylglycine-generating enzyme required for sulfatase activity
VSSAALSPEEQEKISASRIAYEREQQEKDRVAREELAREAEARRKAQEDKERQRKEQEEKVRKEKEERDERERQQREQMERVERQARELEERLAKLATSMPPSQATVADLETTQVHQGGSTGAVSGVSLPGAAASIPPRLEVSIPSKPKSNSMMMIGVAGLVVLLLAGAVAGYFLWLKPRVVSGGPGTNTNPNINQGPSPTPVPTKAEMAEIPGGTFLMGRDDGPLNELPAHSVPVPSFFMDKTEVTNAEYEQFVQETNRRTWPEDWKGPKAPYGREKYPVAFVSFEDANDFAKWRSNRDGLQYRLPTEEEWEYAARNGDKNDLYPWGNSWKNNSAVLLQTDAEPVGSRPDGKNLWAVQDLIGNVWEWTSSKLSVYPGSDGVIPNDLRGRIIFRGGGYTSNPADKVNPVSSCVRSAGVPSFKTGNLGFRLVRPAQ